MLEPRILPAAAVVPPTSTVAVQTSPQPTNKVAAATTAAGGAGVLITGAMVTWGGPAIIEILGVEWTAAHPASTQIIVAVVSGLVALLIPVIGRYAAYNVLDAPNVAMAPVTSPTAVDIRAA
jgi:hypothetical protein